MNSFKQSTSLNELVNMQKFNNKTDTEIICDWFSINGLEVEGIDMISKIAKTKMQNSEHRFKDNEKSSIGKFTSSDELYKSYINLEREYTKSRQELAEKERLLRKYAATSCPINQDKISFCIEKLEQVLVLIQNAVNLKSPEYDLVGLYDAVSNQIEELKKGMK